MCGNWLDKYISTATCPPKKKNPDSVPDHFEHYVLLVLDSDL